MFFTKVCFILEALGLILSLPYAVAAPQRGIWSTMMNPFASISFSVSMTTEGASSSPTLTAWDSSTEDPDLWQLTQSTNSSHSCTNIVCLPLSPWTKLEAQPTSTPVANTDACSQISSPRQTNSVMKFNFTDTCDSVTDMAEDCRVTLDCDTSRGLYPTCERGECRCLAKACFRRSMCLGYRQCRESDEHVCIKEGNNADGVGTCGCQPRITSCLFQESPHHYCAAGSNCTERYFSLYPEFPYCSTGDSMYPLGKCECRHFDCFRTGDERDYEVCKDLVDCDSNPLGSRPYCTLKYGDESRGADDGYCSCGS
ncbi:hypothetical protein V8C37DRAFT_250839 [Trichoderma ceciliae]